MVTTPNGAGVARGRAGAALAAGGHRRARRAHSHRYPHAAMHERDAHDVPGTDWRIHSPCYGPDTCRTEYRTGCSIHLKKEKKPKCRSEF
jgi:hypothetical protein